MKTDPPANHGSPPDDHSSSWRRDLPASLVVFLVATPLCLGIALASGAPVATGLVTGIIGGIVVGSLAGSPLQVSGPAAGLTVVCAELIRQHGMAGLGVVVLVAGGIQLAAGIARLGKWFTAVSPAVIHGMLSGIGVLILAGQLHVMVDAAPQGSGVSNILALPTSLGRGLAWPNWGTAGSRRARMELLQTLNRRQSQQAAIRTAVERQLSLGSAEHPGAGETPVATTTADWSVQATKQSQLIQDLRGDLEQIRSAAPAADPWIQSLDGPFQRAETAMASAADRLATGDVVQLSATQSEALTAIRALLDSQKDQPSALLLGVLTLVVILVWNRIATGAMRAVPGALVGILVASGLAAWLEIPVLRVNVPDDLAADLTWISWQAVRDMSPRAIVIGALMMAAIASAETLLCANAIDKMHSGPRTRYDQELMAQGVGNLLCGCLGVLPMTGVIVRSATNVQAGAKTRLSAILHGVWLVVFMILLKDLMRSIPVCSLAGILVYTGFRLVDVKGFRKLWQQHRAGAWIFLATLVVIVVEDLLTGVITGIVLSALKLLRRFSHFEAELTTDNGRHDLRLRGAATFLRLPVLSNELARIPPRSDVHAHLDELSLVDHACLELLIDWGKQYEAHGGRFHIDWEELHSRFKSEPQRAKAV